MSFHLQPFNRFPIERNLSRSTTIYEWSNPDLHNWFNPYLFTLAVCLPIIFVCCCLFFLVRTEVRRIRAETEDNELGKRTRVNQYRTSSQVEIQDAIDIEEETFL